MLFVEITTKTRHRQMDSDEVIQDQVFPVPTTVFSDYGPGLERTISEFLHSKLKQFLDTHFLMYFIPYFTKP